jgi:hypothetical protein
MTQVWHLVQHNLRAHRTILLAWLASVVALPLLAVAPWSEQLAADAGVGAALFLQGARVLLGLVAIASIVQAGSPVDERTFWRTRPIGSRVLALAHVLTVGMCFVVIPTLIVFAVAVIVGVPASHWPATVAMVVVMESALAGFGLVVASRSRGLATFIIAVVVGLATMFFLLGALSELRRHLPWVGQSGMADPLKGLWATLGLGAVVLPVLFSVAMAGPRRQRTFLVGILALLLLGVGVWFVPALRFVGPPPIDPQVRVMSTSVTAEPVTGSPGALALVVGMTPGARQPRDSWRFSLQTGKLTTASGVRWVEGSPSGHLPRVQPPEVRAALVVLSADEVRTLAGTRIRFEGQLQGEVERHLTEAEAPLVPGAVLSTAHLRFAVSRVHETALRSLGRMHARVEGTEIYLSSPAIGFRHGHAYVLRDQGTGCEVPAYSWPTAGSRVMQLALLPSLAYPFTVVPTELAQQVSPPCAVDRTRARVEMRSHETRGTGLTPVSLEFLVPAAPPESPESPPQPPR